MDIVDGGDVLDGAVRADVALLFGRCFVLKQCGITGVEALENIGRVHLGNRNYLKTTVFVAEFQRISETFFGKSERSDVGELDIRTYVIVFKV